MGYALGVCCNYFLRTSWWWLVLKMPGFLGKDPIWLLLFQMGWEAPTRQNTCCNIFLQGYARYQRRRIPNHYTRTTSFQQNPWLFGNIWDLHYMAILSNAKSPWISINDHLISDFFDVFLPVGGILHPLSQVVGKSNRCPKSGDGWEPPKSLESGFAIITWNNPKNWRNPKNHQGTCYLSFFRVDFPM